MCNMSCMYVYRTQELYTIYLEILWQVDEEQIVVIG